MNLIEWNPELEVGHPVIDADHRTLVDLVNRLANPETTVEQALIVCDALVAHALSHFAREEQLMRAVGYRNAVAHAKEHLHLSDELGSRRDALASGTVTGAELGRFVRDWFLAHALFADRGLAKASLPPESPSDRA